jgi:hypothetical protein
MLKYLYLSVACTMLTPTCFAGPTEVAPPPPHGKHDAHRGIGDTVEEGGSLQKASQRNYNRPETPEKEIVDPPHGKHASHHEAEEGADTLPSTSRKNYKGPLASRKEIVDPPHGKHASHRISIEPTDEEHNTVAEKSSRSKTRGRP